MAPKRKVVTTEEKKAKLLKFFKDEFGFYSIKEIESQGSKATGISSMQIKDILQLLIDDDMIKFDKCGSMNLYWCFQYDLTKGLLAKNERYEKQIGHFLEEKNTLLEEIKKGQQARSAETDDGSKAARAQLLERIRVRKSEKEQLAGQLDSLKQNDPERLRDMYAKLHGCRGEAEKYADYIEMLVSYLCRENGIDSQTLRKELGVADYYEDLPGEQK